MSDAYLSLEDRARRVMQQQLAAAIAISPAIAGGTMLEAGPTSVVRKTPAMPPGARAAASRRVASTSPTSTQTPPCSISPSRTSLA